VLACGVALAVLTGLLLGGARGVLLARRQPAAALGGAGARGSTTRWTRVRTALVVGEVALSLVLVAASASLARSYLAVTAVPLGFRAERVLTVGTSLPESRFDERRRVLAVQELVQSCAGLPGVASVAAVNTLPLTREGEGWGLVAADHPAAADPRPEDWTMARVRAVTSGYFRTLGIPLLAGRGFEPADDGQPVVMVSRLAARRLWPGLDARQVVGRRLAGETQPVVVGVVEDTRASGIDAEVRPYLYVPLWLFAPEDLALVVRTEEDPMTVAAAVRAEIRRIASDQPVEVRTMRGLVADWMAPRRFQTVLMSVFGAFALAIAAVGIFGLLSYSMAQRRRELGVRVALGASRWGIVAGVARQAGTLALGGGALGLGLALLALPLLRSVLYGIGPLDPWALVSCTLVLAATAVAAALVPAWRAARLDPVSCLRAE
jgi:predicted permease